MQLDTEKGFSVYFFVNKSSDYCIIDKEDEYSSQRNCMNIGSILLTIAVLFAIPLVLVAVYERFCEKMTDSQNMRSIVWSIMFVSAVCAGIMFIYDVYTAILNIPLYPSKPSGKGYHSIFIYFVIFGVFLVALIVGDMVLMGSALYYIIKRMKGKPFPIPKLFAHIGSCLGNLCYCCFGCCKGAGNRGGALESQQAGDPPAGDQPAAPAAVGQGQQWSKCVVVILLLGSVSFTFFLQLSSFHSVYILLGILTTPVETLSVTTFYIAYFFCMVAFTAFVLKMTDNEDKNVLKIILSVLTGCIFIACAVLFMMFFHNYIIMVQSYQHGGFLTIIGSVLPSAVVTAGGYIGTKLLDCIKTPQS